MLSITRPAEQRALDALSHVLPRTGRIQIHIVPPSRNDSGADLIINGTPVQVKWAGEGWLHDIYPLLSEPVDRQLIVVVNKISPGARAKLEEAGISWVDETGAAEIVAGPIIISRAGRPVGRPEELKRWTPAVQSTAEALLCGIDATVSATQAATGLSSGSCTKALRFLAKQELLISDAQRGPNSARRVKDYDRLLNAYAAAVAQEPSSPSIQVGIVWRDPVAGLSEIGRAWDAAGVRWACTGVVAASVIAPYLSGISNADVYIDTDSQSGLESAARTVGLEPIAGGRLTLRPFPTTATLHLSTVKQRLCTAPWPRVYADLRRIGVRGEEAAEHLREVANAERERAKP
jgi:hypothetical protein